jgi:hypothetical protein
VRRLITFRSWRREWRLTTALIVSGVLVAFAVGLREHDTAQADHRICTRVDALDSAILATLRRSQKALPLSRYYLIHPAELAAAQHEVARQIREFSKASC